MRSASQRRQTVSCAVSLLLLTSACRPVTWKIDGGERGSCLVVHGMSQADVATACGLPTGAGWQPKRVRARVSGLTVCSAPGHIYGNLFVLYDCEGSVSTVEWMPATGYLSGFIADLTVEDYVRQLQRSAERLSAVEKLAEMGAAARAAVPALRKLLEDHDDQVRTAARLAIERIEDVGGDVHANRHEP